MLHFTLVWVRVFVTHFQEHPGPVHTWDISLCVWGTNLPLLGLVRWKCSPRCPLFREVGMGPTRGRGSDEGRQPTVGIRSHQGRICSAAAVAGGARRCRAWVSASPAIPWVPCSLPIISQSWFPSLASKEPRPELRERERRQSPWCEGARPRRRPTTRSVREAQ